MATQIAEQPQQHQNHQLYYDPQSHSITYANNASMQYDAAQDPSMSQQAIDGVNGQIPAMVVDDTENDEDHIDFSNVYALHTFVANLEGQVCVLKGDSLELLDDSNSYWWLVKCIKTDEIGYIPAENVETPFERLARLNRQRNIEISAPNSEEILNTDNPEHLSYALTQYDSMTAFPRKPNTRGVNIIFAELPLSVHPTEYDDDDDEYESDEDVPGNATGLQNSENPLMGSRSNSQPGPSDRSEGGGFGFMGKKTNNSSIARVTIGQSFIKRILGGGKVKKQPPPFNTEVQRQGSITSLNSDSSSDTSSLNGGASKGPGQEPINVVRIFAGNVDLKATFKTVALTKSMTVGELLNASLRRFRVPETSINEYYVSVLHMDSLERRLKEADVVYELLDSLRHRQLPGVNVAAMSRVFKGDPSSRVAASVQVNDDNIIRFIVNKKLNIFEKSFHLVRVVSYDESDPSGKIRTYKTIGIKENIDVAEVVELAIKKFKFTVSNEPVYNGGREGVIEYFLATRVKNVDTLRQMNEKIYDILLFQEESPDEVDLVLLKDWVPMDARAVGYQHVPLQHQQLQQLQQQPMAMEHEPAQQQQHWDLGARQRTFEQQQQQQQPPMQVQLQLPVTQQSGSASPLKTSLMDDPEINSILKSKDTFTFLNEFPTAGNAAVAEDVNARSTEELSMSTSTVATSTPAPPPQGGILMLSGTAEPAVGYVAPRGASLVASKIAANGSPPIANANGKTVPAPEPSPPIAAAPTTPSPATSPPATITTTASGNPLKQNLLNMEEYLNEMIKTDPAKMNVHESAPSVNGSMDRPVSAYSEATTPRTEEYNDNGLNELLRKPTTNSLYSIAPASMQPPTSRGSNGQQANRERWSGHSSRSSLKDIYQELEADLNASLAASNMPMPANAIAARDKRRPSHASIVSRKSDGEGSVSGTIGRNIREGQTDSAIVLEKFKDAENLLSNMQRDLDQLVSVAISAFGADIKSEVPSI
ncbi:hypothetical protein BJ742DRAFT_780911 [Cladochytrium replicatum]|nr:hypothetical protein BJ742DRAFT_780911 [Cladochytrium replicatum]